MYKVLFLGWEYYPVFTGGLGVVCEAMAEEMASQGLEVFVALPQVPKELPVSKVNFPVLKTEIKNSRLEYIYNENIKVNNINVSLDPYLSETFVDSIISELNVNQITTDTKKILMSDGLYGNDLLYKVHIYKELIKESLVDLEFDVIHAHDWMTYIAAIEAKNITGKKCVLHVHATEHDRTAGNPNELIFDIEKETLKKADVVLAISEHTKKTLIDKYKIDPSKIKVIHNALSDKHYYHIDEKINLGKPKKVLFLGRAVVQKGVEHFIHIAKKITEKLPDTIFIFAGDGQKLPTAIELINDLGLQNNFLFTGPVTREEGDVLFNSADLYLMTSISEPFGITALESVNQGTPVIVSKTSGVAEVLPNALTVDYWDIKKFADYAVNVLENKVLYDELVENQTRDYQKISWKNQVEKMIEIYHTLLT